VTVQFETSAFHGVIPKARAFTSGPRDLPKHSIVKGDPSLRNEIWFSGGGDHMAFHAVDLKGKSRDLASAPIRMHFEDVAPDGKILLSTEALHWEFGVGESKSGRWQPLTSFAHHSEALYPGASPDGKLCVIGDGDGHYWLQSLDGTTAHEINGIAPGERIINWHGDSNNLFLAHPDGPQVDVYSLNVSTGERKLWTRFSPPDTAAIFGNISILITPDGSRYTYMIRRVYSNLFLATGIH
jgi:hypothetical protein